MRITERLLLPMLMTLVLCWVSCTNDYEMWDDYISQDWEASLNQIISENYILYSNSGISLNNYEETDIYPLNQYSFINSDARYPVMTGNYITLAPYEFIDFDSIMCHVKSFHIDNMVKYVMNNKSSFKAIKLEWLVNGVPYITYAIFDKNNGDLIYDNILYNTITMDNKRLSKLRKFKLTRSENWGYQEGDYQGSEMFEDSDTFSYHDSNGNWIATVSINWSEHGYWALHIIDVDYYTWRFEYRYIHSYTTFTSSQSQNPNYSNYNVQKLAMELQPTDYNYRIKYYFYIGANPYPVTLSNEPVGEILTSNGKGIVKILEEKPYRAPDIVDKRIFNVINP
ncbi:MAG: hypothetical protein J6W18_04220 [Bacteroidaceae bacterium]|nr:hypothetical protein [Bacteroidaceae bacterium]